MKRFVIGDIHGAHKALVQCLERAEFDKRKDLLICLGDLSDGWPDCYQVIEELLTVSKLVLIRGNHDVWLSAWFEKGDAPDIWLSQGGSSTIHSYTTLVPETHKQILRTAVKYYILDDMLFVHGGYDTKKPIEEQEEDQLIWDRSLVEHALMHRHFRDNNQLTKYKKVFVGHTPTLVYKSTLPIEAYGVVMMDTGVGFSGGVLTIMDIDSGNYWQSDPVNILYPGFGGR
ncbi:MAG: metallophosphoesterase [Bacteroidales bacterium]|nr:metallophosphoesterase [Bacteroidales bacterium]